MAILRIAQLGHPVLRMVARPVTLDEIRSPAFQQLCDDMLETLDDYDGAGLAAPQVHVPIRLVVATLNSDVGPEFFVNPKIIPNGTTTARTWEGCLSVEGLRGLVERPDRVRVEAFDRDGSAKVYELEGHPAVVIQHECDHLDGVVYVDKVLPKSLMFLREFRRFRDLEDDDEEVSDDAPADASVGESLADFDDDVYGELTSEEFQGHKPGSL